VIVNFSHRQQHSQLKWSSTSATCGLIAGRGGFPHHTIWSLQCSHLHWYTYCTRIHRHGPLHSYHCSLHWSTGRCRGHKWWTSSRQGRKIHYLRHYLNNQIPASCSCPSHWIQWTNCTQRSTSCNWLTAGQISACSGRLYLSADVAVRCRASSCLSCRWIRLWTPPMNGWRSRTRRCFAESATEYSWLHNKLSCLKKQRNK